MTQSKLSQFKLFYETTPSGDELVAEAIERQWLRAYKKAVLFINKAGLIQLAKFRRVK